MGFFFFSSRRRHTRWNCDWSSDVCSSDLVGISVGAAIACDDVEIVGARDDALGEQEARDELLIVARGSHRDAEIDTAQANLEGLFDGEIIQALGGGVIPNFDNAMPNGGDASRNF